MIQTIVVKNNPEIERFARKILTDMQMENLRRFLDNNAFYSTGEFLRDVAKFVDIEIFIGQHVNSNGTNCAGIYIVDKHANLQYIGVYYNSYVSDGVDQFYFHFENYER